MGVIDLLLEQQNTRRRRVYYTLITSVRPLALAYMMSYIKSVTKYRLLLMINMYGNQSFRPRKTLWVSEIS